MEGWQAAAIAALLGAAGGLVYPLLLTRSWEFPHCPKDADGRKLRWEPGFLGDLFVGAVSGGAFWGFIGNADYSPHTFAGALIAGASGGSLLLSWVEQQTHNDERRHLTDALQNTLSELQKLKSK